MSSSKVRIPLRALTIGVLVALVASSVAITLLIRSVVADQQRRLLTERASEAGVLIDTVFSQVGTALPTLAALPAPHPGATSQFTSAARAELGLIGTIAALEPADGGFRVVASVGTGPAAGAIVAPDVAALARQARSGTGATGTGGVVIGKVHTSSGPRLCFAMATRNGEALYECLVLDPSKSYNLGANGPFSELDGVIYASSTPNPATQVVATTMHLPLAGPVVRQIVQIGSQRWLLEVRSKQPLVGTFAARAPWAALAGGLAAAALATVLVETLGRRRAYALALVEERTEELQDALEEQSRLEQDARRAKDAAEAANRAKSEFLSRMSHELRTPLNAVLGFGQLLQLDELSPGQEESVDQILKGGRHLLDLINEVLDISRIETGSLALSPEAVSVADVVGDVLTLMGPLADERQVGLTALGSVPGGPDSGAHVLADRQRLKQILLNLVANAIKYNHHGGSVTVSSEAGGPGELRIVVADNGPGIRAADFDRLFVPFERLGAESSDVEGSGVGLALCRRLAEAMGGSVEVESTLGEGSRFWAQLPTVEDPLERYDRITGGTLESADTSAGERRYQVVYIEDNLSNLRLIERVLGQRGDVELLPAMQGRLGLDLVREHHPDLVLLDLHLPDMGGAEVLRQLRDDPGTSAIPVIVLSADATAGQIERLLADGADAYLTKPLDVSALMDVLDEALARAVVGPSGS